MSIYEEFWGFFYSLSICRESSCRVCYSAKFRRDWIWFHWEKIWNINWSGFGHISMGSSNIVGLARMKSPRDDHKRRKYEKLTCRVLTLQTTKNLKNDSSWKRADKLGNKTKPHNRRRKIITIVIIKHFSENEGWIAAEAGDGGMLCEWIKMMMTTKAGRRWRFVGFHKKMKNWGFLLHSILILLC